MLFAAVASVGELLVQACMWIGRCVGHSDFATLLGRRRRRPVLYAFSRIIYGAVSTPPRFIHVFAYNLTGRRRGGVGAASTPPRFIRVFAYNLTRRRRHPVWLFKNLKGRRCGVTAQRPRHDPLQHCRAGVGARGVQRRAGADK